MKFKESQLAHKYCKGIGIEIGPASHNPFNIDGCLFVSPKERIDFWNHSQEIMGEKPQDIDEWGDAENLPFDDNSFDYVISSHVIEHVPNPIKAFTEWNRVLKKDGIMFMIFPKRNADPVDLYKPISTLQSFIDQYENPQPLNDNECHIWIFTLQLMLDIIDYCNNTFSQKWDIIEKLETDDKVGNGHCIVCRKR